MGVSDDNKAGWMNETAQRIVEAFGRQVERSGYAGATLDDVARELKISKKTIYVHFEGKRDIYAHVVTREARRMKAQLAAAVSGLPTNEARLEAAVRSMLAVARTHIDETGEEEWLQEYEVAADAFRQAFGELLRDLVEAGMQAGEFSQGDAAFVERAVTALVLDYLMQVNADPSYDRDEEVVRRIIGFVR